MRGYETEKRFYIDLLKRDDVCETALKKDEVYEAALYLQDGDRMIEFAVGPSHMRAIEKLQVRVSAKIREGRAPAEDGSC